MDEQRVVVGGVDTHKDLHFAAVVDDQDHVLGNQCFPSTRHGYKQMLAWLRSFGELARIGVECTGTYGAGLLRYLQKAGVTVLEVTAPDKYDRRKRGKDDTIDAENAAHAALGACQIFCVERGHEIISKGLFHDRSDDHQKAQEAESCISVPG